MFGSKGTFAEVAEVVLLALGLYLVITFAVQTVHVIGLSMFPTVDDGDYLVAAKLDYRLHNPQRGDVIIMRDPYDQSRDFIKRVIALPGERIQIRDAMVYVNGHRLDEPYLTSPEPWRLNVNWPAASAASPDGRLLGSDEYFVLGDNRNHSSDSRVFGPVKRDQIEARAWIRVLPFGRLGPVGGPQPRLSGSRPDPGRLAA